MKETSFHIQRFQYLMGKVRKENDTKYHEEAMFMQIKTNMKIQNVENFIPGKVEAKKSYWFDITIVWQNKLFYRFMMLMSIAGALFSGETKYSKDINPTHDSPRFQIIIKSNFPT
jgi:hypothetical protein